MQASPVWSQYESQKHDLFIEDKPVAGYLTSQPGTVRTNHNPVLTSRDSILTNHNPPLQAGYLTMSRSVMPSVPPPIENNEAHDNSDLMM